MPFTPNIFFSKIIRERLWAAVKANTDAEVMNWFDEKYIKTKRFLWYISDISEIQAFFSLPVKEQHLFREFFRYYHRSEIDKFLIKKNKTIPPDFRSFLMTWHKKQKHQFLEDENLNLVFEKYFDEITSLFGFSSLEVDESSKY